MSALAMTVTVENEQPTGEIVRKEFDIQSLAPVRDGYVLRDDDGDGRLIVSGDEIAELARGER